MASLTFQPSLFYNWDYFLNLPTNRKPYELFQNLDLSQFEDKNHGHGQTGYSRHAMIRALIVKDIVQLSSIPRLVEYLKDNATGCTLVEVTVRNHIALAHITLSLVALTALKLGKPDKINAYLKFAD